MYGRMCLRTWGFAAGLVCAVVSSAYGSEPMVQDFDGWKITIRPGVSSVADSIPPSPRVYPQTNSAARSGSVHLISHLQETPPPAPGPAINPADSTTPAAGDNLPLIIPGESQCCDSKPVVMPPEGTVDPRYLAQMYSEIYKTIPFVRAEYDANPSYLHDTTVEFLFGKMRPTVIHRGTVNVNNNNSGGGVPWAYGGPGYGMGVGGFMYPPLQLVVPGTGLRVHHLN